MHKRWLSSALLLFCSAFAASAAEPSRTPVDVANYKEPIKVACVGDSITAGYSAGGKQAAWPAQLGAMLGDRWAFHNFGVSGTTLTESGASYRNTEEFKSALNLNPDVVVIMLGTNDTKPRVWDNRKQNYETDYRSLIKLFTDLPSKPIVLLCTPPFVSRKNAYAIHEESIVAQLPIITKIAEDLKLDVIDVHGALQQKAELLPDGVHPNKEGAAIISRAVYQVLTGQPAPEAPPAAAETNGKPKRKAK